MESEQAPRAQEKGWSCRRDRLHVLPNAARAGELVERIPWLARGFDSWLVSGSRGVLIQMPRASIAPACAGFACDSMFTIVNGDICLPVVLPPFEGSGYRELGRRTRTVYAVILSDRAVRFMPLACHSVLMRRGCRPVCESEHGLRAP